MKRTIVLLLATITAFSCLYAQATKNPFTKLGYKKQVVYSSSKGEFDEFHDQNSVIEIGSVYFNTKTNKIVGFISEDAKLDIVNPATTAMSVDPLCEKYYWISPYAYCLNNPVNAVDPDGKRVIIVGTKEYQKQVLADFKQLQKDNSEVGKMLSALISSPNDHIIEMPKNNDGYNYSRTNKEKEEKGAPQGSKVGYDPNNKENRSGEKRTPRVGLAHELKHSSQADKGEVDTKTTTETGVHIYEVDAINTENKVREKTGDKKNTEYGGKKISERWLDN